MLTSPAGNMCVVAFIIMVCSAAPPQRFPFLLFKGVFTFKNKLVGSENFMCIYTESIHVTNLFFMC